MGATASGPLVGPHGSSSGSGAFEQGAGDAGLRERGWRIAGWRPDSHTRAGSAALTRGRERSAATDAGVCRGRGAGRGVWSVVVGVVHQPVDLLLLVGEPAVLGLDLASL